MGVLSIRLWIFWSLSKRLKSYGSLSKRLQIYKSLGKSLQAQALEGICWLSGVLGCKSHVGFGLNKLSEAPAGTKSHSVWLKEALQAQSLRQFGLKHKEIR